MRLNGLNDLKMGVRIFRMIQEAGVLQRLDTIADVREMVTLGRRPQNDGG